MQVLRKKKKRILLSVCYTLGSETAQLGRREGTGLFYS